MEVKLDDEQTNKLLQAAMLAALGEHGQAAIVDKFLKYLTTKPSTLGQTPLDEMFQFQAHQIARKIVEDKFANDPEFIKAIEDVFALAVKKFLNVETKEALADKMASKMVDAFNSRY